ncbi:RnfABCDGE type electron transport complex subunit D [Cetobacterium somerae]|uniref:RnfABCDGE type electron transport complex subunit D n=1 Tax=Cetobacterium sp. NK01 TaxID=2993530 RepID=UPI002115E3DD|nr:RnfABCDGE type electron transport complex subunit D [Cetobacterium sp. NK01]MCQ8211884.1 RnfABCDGE type electron transport complex subunit D [Cetobacterium sp. NK01]
MAKILKMGPSPHIRTKETVDDVMYDVIIALLPALLAACYFFGIRAIIVTAVSILSCMVTEYVCQKLMKQDVQIFDGSAVITGILYAFVIPPYMSLVYVVIGAVVSIALGKMVFGGLGHNIFNPALVGRAFVQASWPVAITTFMYDDVGGATLLDTMKRGLSSDVALIENGNLYLNTFIGKMGGCLGETSALALLIGGLYLIYKKQIDWKVPAIMIGTVFVASLIAGANPILHIFSGGLFLGAFFMATDMVTSPHTPKGRAIFAFGIGVLVSLIRFKGGYPEGVAYSILIMNGFVPLINRYTNPKKFGEVK